MKTEKVNNEEQQEPRQTLVIEIPRRTEAGLWFDRAFWFCGGAASVFVLSCFIMGCANKILELYSKGG